jgi:hypothetical protein
LTFRVGCRVESLAGMKVGTSFVLLFGLLVGILSLGWCAACMTDVPSSCGCCKESRQGCCSRNQTTEKTAVIEGNLSSPFLDWTRLQENSATVFNDSLVVRVGLSEDAIPIEPLPADIVTQTHAFRC